MGVPATAREGLVGSLSVSLLGEANAKAGWMDGVGD